MRSQPRQRQNLIQRHNGGADQRRLISMRLQLSLPPITPCARAEIRLACGAASGWAVMVCRLAAPANP